MNKYLFALIIALLFAVQSPAQDAATDEAANGDAAATDETANSDAADATTTTEEEEDTFGARVTKLDGPVDEVIIELPNGDSPDIEEDALYPEGTQIATGDATVIISFEGRVRGLTLRNAMISIRPISEVRLDRFVLNDSTKSVMTRIKVKTGEVRVKITEERADYSTDMKVATPNATASVVGTDVQAIGYNSNSGTYVEVASGAITARRGDGTTRDVTGGSFLDDSAASALDAEMGRGAVLAPIGMVEFEVSVTQLQVAGVERSASDINNPATNPTANAGIDDSFATRAKERAGTTLPARSGRVVNRR